jgi:hypothetical protein
MLNAIVISIRFIFLVLGGQKQVALENAALRQQLAVFKRNVPRPKLNNRDRLFWIGLYLIWQDWKSALIFVQPDGSIFSKRSYSGVAGYGVSKPNTGSVGGHDSIASVVRFPTPLRSPSIPKINEVIAQMQRSARWCRRI